jgi:MFS family permease
MTMNIVGICMLLQSRPEMLLKQVGNDAGRMATLMANLSAAVGVFEFMLNPTAGKLSDQYGRRPFLLASPLVNIVMKALVFVNPSLLSLSLER